jgi:hypothetical protein
MQQLFNFIYYFFTIFLPELRDSTGRWPAAGVALELSSSFNFSSTQEKTMEIPMFP